MRFPITTHRTAGSSASPLSLFDKFFGEFFTEPMADAGALAPRVNVAESDTELTFEFELPGVEESAIDIEVLGNKLSVKAERKLPLEQGSYHAIEHHHGELVRRVVLPRGLETDAISAQFKNGLLTIRVPKSEPVKARKIEISG